MKLRLQQLHDLGQSIWYDNIQRKLLINSPDGSEGVLARMIARGDIRGVTSNPTIFNNAISKTNDYDSALIPLAWSGWDAEQIFWQLAIEDIRSACDLFSSVYHDSQFADGYVSLEVNPTLANDSSRTIAQVKQLWETVSRPNLMVKIPATPEGLPAIREAIAAGINVNVTLIFSIERYRAVIDAYLAGLKERMDAGLPVAQITSVASFFVSRMDTKVDSLLPKDSLLRGKTAIAYTKLAYEEFRANFGSEHFASFRAAGCKIQRPLWASTSTKDPSYPDTMYVDSLIGPDTVNTVPPQTLDAFREHGTPRLSIMEDLDGARDVIQQVEALGISIDQVTSELETEGVASFSNAFSSMLKSIDERRSAAVADLGPLAQPVKARVATLMDAGVSTRIWSHDPTLWTDELAGEIEISKRLGWLDLPDQSSSILGEIRDLVSQILAEGFSHVLLLGMGGSSLAPEVVDKLFSGLNSNKISFSILDSTDPAQVAGVERTFPPEKTLYIVSSKSGGTAEINAMFQYFWERSHQAADHFIAITDNGTSLDDMANNLGFRAVFQANPNVGGRYSALTHFGLVPAGLIGVDLKRLLERAAWMKRQCTPDMSAARNPGLVLGAVIGEGAVQGYDKLTILADTALVPFGAWLEQLVAESSGKMGKGIIPIIDEPMMDADAYGSDRLFVYFRKVGELDQLVENLRNAHHPTLVMNWSDEYDVGVEIYKWEMAIAVACSVLKVNAFDQPDVQDSKDRTKEKSLAYSKLGVLPEGQALWESSGTRAYSTVQLPMGDTLAALKAFFKYAQKRDYIALNAYVQHDQETGRMLSRLRKAIQTSTGCATTLGFGPRFLHSTGQLHKGGPSTGLFLQITVDPENDIPIPEQGMSFGTLERAQALGDYEALAARGRRILRLNFNHLNGVIQLVKDLE